MQNLETLTPLVTINPSYKYVEFRDTPKVTIKAKKNNCMFTVAYQKNLGLIGRFLFFFTIGKPPEIVVPGS